jgi:hypothetical protein
LTVFKETDKIEMIAGRFAAAEGLGADLAMTKYANYRRGMISRPFFCMHGYDVTSQELQNVHDISSFLLHARI